MIIKNNIPDSKGKALYGFIGLLSFSIVLLLWPQQSGHSQPEIKPPTASRQTVDSVTILRGRNDRQDSINLAEARSLVKLTKNLNQQVRRRADIRVKAIKPTVVLQFNGQVFEAEVKPYKNYLIVNIDTFLTSVDTAGVYPVSELVDTVTNVDRPPAQAAPVKRNFFQKLFKHK